GQASQVAPDRGDRAGKGGGAAGNSSGKSGRNLGEPAAAANGKVRSAKHVRAIANQENPKAAGKYVRIHSLQQASTYGYSDETAGQVRDALPPLHGVPKACDAQQLGCDAAREKERHGFEGRKPVKQQCARRRREGKPGEPRDE